MLTYLQSAAAIDPYHSTVEVEITGAVAGQLLVAGATSDDGGALVSVDGGAGELLSHHQDADSVDPNSEVDVLLLTEGGDIVVEGSGSVIAFAMLFDTDYPIETATLTRLLERETPSQTNPSYTPYVNVVAGDILLVPSTVAQNCGDLVNMGNYAKTAGTAVITRVHHSLWWTNTGGSPDQYAYGFDAYLVTTGGTFSFCGFSVHVFRLRSTVLKQYTMADSGFTLG